MPLGLGIPNFVSNFFGSRKAGGDSDSESKMEEEKMEIDQVTEQVPEAIASTTAGSSITDPVEPPSEAPAPLEANLSEVMVKEETVLEENLSLTESQASTDVSGESSDELEKGATEFSEPASSVALSTEASDIEAVKDEIGTESELESEKEIFQESIVIMTDDPAEAAATVEIVETQESEEIVELIEGGNSQPHKEFEVKENGEEGNTDFTDENGTESCVEITRRRTSQDREGNCYCGKERNLNIVELLCASCSRWHHESCVGLQIGKQMPFMTNYTFLCKNCSSTGLELFKKNPAAITQLCITALANLTQQSVKDGSLKKLFSRDKEIVPFFEMHGESMTSMRRVTQTWQTRVTKALVSKDAASVFAVEEKPDDQNSPYYGLTFTDLTQIRPNYEAMIKVGSIKVTDGGVQGSNAGFGRRGAKRRIVGDASALSQASVAKKARGDSFLPKMVGHGYPTDHPYNKDGYRYILAEPDSNAPYRQEFDESNDWAGKPIPGWLYRVLNPCSVLLALHDRAPQLKVSEDRLSVTGEKGYCMIRATHGVTRGSWYWEAQITDQPEGSHTRIGFCQMFGNLQGPLGYDRFGYSWRSRFGTKFHEAKGKSYCKGGYTKGDVLGFLIILPDTNPKVPLVPPSYKDRPLVRFKTHLYYEDKDEKNVDNDPTNIRPGSKIICFKNGECQGIAYEDIREGTYYPAVSLYKSCTVNINFGPNFWTEPSKEEFPHRGMHERAEDAIVEQTVSDLAFLTEHHGKLRLDNFVIPP